MTSPLEASVAVVAYMALFAGVGFVFVFVNLLIGRFLRPSDPHEEKLEIYECGEPTIGSSFVQFDLRFYVVALVFIIFDVEVAFLFPWATVFGKTTNLMALAGNGAAVTEHVDTGQLVLTADAQAIYHELGVRNSNAGELATSEVVSVEQLSSDLRELATLAIYAVMFFFIVLLIGFAYEWKTGALDWVRAIARERGISSSSSSESPSGLTLEQDSMLSA